MQLQCSPVGSMMPDECKRAKSHLKQLWSTIKSIRENRLREVEEDTEGLVQESGDESDEVESLLKRKETSSRRSTTQNRRNQIPVLKFKNSNLMGFLKNLGLIKKYSVLKYWVTKSSMQLILYQLSKIVLEVPATQVSVERLFSH